jgi:hypothetical protein
LVGLPAPARLPSDETLPLESFYRNPNGIGVEVQLFSQIKHTYLNLAARLLEEIEKPLTGTRKPIHRLPLSIPA